MFCLHENDIWSYFGKHWKKRFYPSCCKSQDSAGDFCIILRVAKQVGTEKKRTVFCYLSVVSTPEAASLRLPAHPQNCTDFALRVLAFTTKSRIIQKELHEQFGLVISLTHLNRLRKANGRAYHAEKKNSSA